MKTQARSSPETIGRYRLLEEIGRGSVGRVYAAYDPNVGRRVALKVLVPPAAADARSDAVLRERFVTEARAAGGLDHPGIVVVHDADVDPERDLAFIAMELLEGDSLGSLLESGRLPAERACAIVAQVAEALDYAHERGVVHRDVKPANILIADDGRVKLADFGVAKVLAASHTVTGMVLGSPAYMSPEQVKSEVIDGRSDLFSLGVVLYECLYGARPFRGESMAAVVHDICEAEPVFPRGLETGVSPALRAVVAMALSKDREERFATGADLADALRTALRTTTWSDTRPVEIPHKIEAVPEPPEDPPEPSGFGALWWLLGGLLLLAAIAFGAGFLLLGANGDDAAARRTLPASPVSTEQVGERTDTPEAASGPAAGENRSVEPPATELTVIQPGPISTEPASTEPGPTVPVPGTVPATAASAKLVILHQNRLKSAEMTVRVDGQRVWSRRMTSDGGVVSRARGDLIRVEVPVEPGRRAVEVTIRGSKGRVDVGSASTATFSTGSTRYLRVKLLPLFDRLTLQWERQGSR